MNIKCVLVLCSTAILLMSCGGKKKQLAYYDNADTMTDSIYDSDFTDGDDNSEISDLSASDVSVPFEEQSGVKFIDVTVNGQFTVKMILDSGCSGTLISIAEAKYLYDKGCFSQDDILGVSESQIADGSIVENMVINLKELVIGNKISCSNVKATVSSNANAPLLLGNEVLNRVAEYSVDNDNKMIKFRLR